MDKFDVIDRLTQKTVRHAIPRVAAERIADRLDSESGAVRYVVVPTAIASHASAVFALSAL